MLEVTIDEQGKPTVTELVRGHPMLVDSAKAAVNAWRYRPFTVKGQAVVVKTYVMVTFGQPYYDAEDLLQLQIDDRLAMTRDAARKGDFSTADNQISLARQTLAASSNASDSARWSVDMAAAELHFQEQKYEEAEKNYRDAVAASANTRRGELDRAESLDKLAALYHSQKRYEDEYQASSQSAGIYE